MAGKNNLLPRNLTRERLFVGGLVILYDVGDKQDDKKEKNYLNLGIGTTINISWISYCPGSARS